MDNSINFKGTFLIHKPSVEVKQALSSAIGKKKHIFNNFINPNDTLYVVRDSADKKIAETIKNLSDVQFEYYPNLSTKSGFETKNLNKAIQIIQNYKGEIINTTDKLLAKIKKPVKFSKTYINKIHDKNIKAIEKEASVKFNDNELIKGVDTQSGVYTIKAPVKDSNGHPEKRTILRVSPPGRFGICYAEYIPLSAKEDTRRIAINRNGKKIFEYINEKSDTTSETISKEKNVPSVFENNFQAAKKYYKEQMNKKLDTKA